MTVIVFPGQGSQIVGMGKDLFSVYPEYVEQADAILGYSIIDLCLHHAEQLNQTQFTQPALYIVNALTFLQTFLQQGKIPDAVAGHSLGEYNALLAANVYDFATGLKLVQKRGELMSQAHDGGMAAIVGLPVDVVQQTLQQSALATISIANYNTYQQFVISGPRDAIAAAQPIFEAIPQARYIPLKVSGAFHSAYMQSAQRQFGEYCTQISFATPKIPVISNVTGKPYGEHDAAQLLTQQITQPVRWVACIEYLLAQGETDFQEVGPGKVLTGLIRKIRSK